MVFRGRRCIAGGGRLRGSGQGNIRALRRPIRCRGVVWRGCRCRVFGWRFFGRSAGNRLRWYHSWGATGGVSMFTPPVSSVAAGAASVATRFLGRQGLLRQPEEILPADFPALLRYSPHRAPPPPLPSRLRPGSRSARPLRQVRQGSPSDLLSLFQPPLARPRARWSDAVPLVSAGGSPVAHSEPRARFANSSNSFRLGSSPTSFKPKCTRKSFEVR